MTPSSIPNEAELIALAERCEQAAGPDRELDVAIAVAIDWRWDDWEEGESTAAGQAAKHGFDWLVGRVFSGTSMWRSIPHFTASLDAAMSLVPEGYVFSVQTDFGLPGRGRVYGDAMGKRDRGYQADAATPALALTAACLRALAALDRKNP